MTGVALPRFLPADAVRLDGGPALAAQQTVRDTLLRLDPDRLLAPFRREAGLPARAPGYGGWEADGLDGHTAGHVLSASSRLAATTGDGAIAALAAHLADGIRECQRAIGTGYVGGVPDGAALWDEILTGRVDAGAFHLNGRWVPLYNLHKTLAGLLDAVEHLGLDSADAALEQFGAWWLRTAGRIDDERFERMLQTEFGGMTEVFARLAVLRRDPAHLALARRFARRALVEPLAAGRDELDGLHANTQIPVVVGCAAIERAAREIAPELVADIVAREGAAARFFFDRVARVRSVPIGGDSVREHFPPASDLATMFTAREGPESCNTVNMIALAAHLHVLTGDDAYLAWAERARVDHVMSAQHPEHGGLVYFTSQRPGHYRVYSPEAEGFWCCMGSGFEAQSRHGALAFGEAGDELRINALIATTARWRGLTVTLRTAPAADGADGWEVEVAADRPVRRALSILIPDGADVAARVEVADDVTAVAAGERWRTARTWTGVTRLRLAVPRALRVERSPDGSAWGWVIDGPDVLALRIPDDAVEYRGTAARMGHIARGPLRPLAGAPMIDPADLATAERLEGGRVRVPTVDGGSIVLEPFARIHDARYTVAFPLADAASAEARRAELERIDEASLGMDARTLDVVAFGEQQPESDHGLEATDEDQGAQAGDRWRRTRGAIRVTLRDWTGTADRIRLTWLAPSEPAGLRVRVGDETVLDETVPPGGSPGSREVRLPEGSAGAVELAVTIEARDGSTPRLRELRVLCPASDR
ncbi:beta-L-arabinofuranosidase domain-containing protein [Microbacterium thalassium]|uniref:DUF1680 family protein n=1 Tax=Microbacterium thalassium TaxID=362649 RepID=A0A7X0FNR1_9MICO|nr:beta-L-arabinofuranosidase domain-containing protein [Microbacterium thalassium]MBB6390893.1 DUF1680 family protein [Microbacterium thalassium]GLK26001.1 hypothetical protein GCM10017607_33200 [Microbacterium thalassium]